jgi:DNA polymerase-1
LDFSRAKQSFSILMRIPRQAERLHPVFACFGTVTGRIRVIEPALQELRRRYRDVLSPEAGMTFRYLDFAQFEPGILAQRANDAQFLQQYNSKDLYAALSNHIFGSDSHRTLCKQFFLAYCYGMSKESIAGMLAGPTAGAAVRKRYQDTIAVFFGAFPGLESYRCALIAELAKTGSVSTLMGNRRVRTSQGTLTHKEQRWAISQAIQGSASLIFKCSLLKLVERFGLQSIVLPMHDAVLMQFDERGADAAETEAKGIMAATFMEWCPDVIPRVATANFAADD